MWFLCGLGNPEKKYKLTRHNLGFNVLDSIIETNNCILIKKDKYKGYFQSINLDFPNIATTELW